MAQNKFTPEQILEMRNVLAEIGQYIPEHHANYVWNSYKIINDTNENQPCMCGSSAAHWRKAVNSMRNYINSLDNDNGNNG